MPKRKTHEEFLQDVYIKLGPEYEVMGPYPGSHGKVPLKHYKCGNTFDKNVHDIITKGSGCPYCNGNRSALYNEQWVRENTPHPYSYVKGYKNMTTKCYFYCEKCESEFIQQPQRLINQHIYGCNCCPTKKKTHAQFLNELGPDCLENYDILDEYQNIDTPIRFQHKRCGATFMLSPYAFIYRHEKQYCPLCFYKKSKGEIDIADFLTKHQIDFQKEFVFPNLMDKRFDFYIPNKNLCIEFDGEQHYHPIEFFGGQEGLEQTQHRDRIKNQFCIDQGIHLLRIPYYEFVNISKILSIYFEEEGSTTIEQFIIN